MLNLDLTDDLYKGLTKEQQQELISLLFKKSKQAMNYFRRTKDISLSKLEVGRFLSYAIGLLSRRKFA